MSARSEHIRLLESQRTDLRRVESQMFKYLEYIKDAPVDEDVLRGFTLHAAVVHDRAKKAIEICSAQIAQLRRGHDGIKP